MDAWAGLPQAGIDTPCEGGCRVETDGDRSLTWPQAIFLVALVVAPVAGVVEAMTV